MTPQAFYHLLIFGLSSIQEQFKDGHRKSRFQVYFKYNFRIVNWKIENRKEWENLIKGEKR